MRVGVQSTSLHSLFKSIEEPPSTIPTARPWSWLRHHDDIARRDAALLLLMGSALGRSSVGRTYLTTAHEAADWLQNKHRKHVGVVVIDVGARIGQLEQLTGETYQ
jgi:hypothetical protein